MESMSSEGVVPFYLLIPINLFSMIGLFVIYLKCWPKTDDLVGIYEDCTRFTAKYRYIIRFVFRKLNPPFNITETTIKVYVLNSQSDVISSLDIEPKLLVTYKVNEPKAPYNTIRFLLYRSTPLKDITFVILNHDGTGEMVVLEVQIQDLNSSVANIGFVNTTIKNLTQENASMAQSFPAATKQNHELEDEVKSSKKLNAIEYLVFIYFSLNLVTLVTIYLIPCTTGVCPKYEDGLISAVICGLTTGLVVYLVYVIISFSYENVIKRQFVVGYQICSLFRYICLLLTTGIALFIGIVASLLVIQGHFASNSDDLFSDHIYWLFASIVAIIVFILLALIFAVICRSCYPSVENRELTKKSERKSKGRSKSRERTASRSKYSEPTQSSKSEQSVTSSVKKSPSTESTGSGYYKELLKHHGKVKSISQYKGPKK